MIARQQNTGTSLVLVAWQGLSSMSYDTFATVRASSKPVCRALNWALSKLQAKKECLAR